MRTNTLIHRGIKLIFVCTCIILLLQAIYPYTRFYYYKPIFVPFQYRLNEDNLVLVEGETFQLRIQGLNKRLHFKTTDFRVAEVLFTGKVFAHRTGTASITVSVDDYEVKCLVTVININKSKTSISIGETVQLRINGTSKSVKWSSDDEDIAEISKDGEVVGLMKGSTTVTGTVLGRTLKCNVIVS